MVSNGGISNLYVDNLSFSDNTFSASEYSFTVSPQDSHEVSVYFTPTQAIPYIGTLTIQNNDPITPSLEVSLAGQGFPVSSGELQASSEMIEFGYTVAGDTSTILVLLFNIGSAPITVSAVEFSNALYF